MYLGRAAVTRISKTAAAAGNCRRAFTLVELLVVIGIIALLLSILIPTLSKARESAQTLKCLSNLKTLGQAMQMYASANKNFLPYPTTTLILQNPGVSTTIESSPQGYIWYNAVDPYLLSNRAAQAEQTNRTGVAAVRTYRSYKQCVVYESFEGSKASGGQGNTQEFAKTYKMNSHLRRIPRSNTASTNTYAGRGSQAKITDVRRSTEFVMIGDGVSLDQTGQIASQAESGQFSMEVNDPTEACPALRHKGGANILFVDGHAANVYIKKIIKRPLVMTTVTTNVQVPSWESEYVNAGGQPTDINTGAKQEFQTPAALGLGRYPNMPLIWSDPPRLYRY
jgi:prepilin-type processing-associated H-X9-DG protein/prepilin-type N-terminal cleavage/methylation domain-containing protein